MELSKTYVKYTHDFGRKMTSFEFKVGQMQLENMLEATITFLLISYMIFDKNSTYASQPRWIQAIISNLTLNRQKIILLPSLLLTYITRKKKKNQQHLP